MEAIQEFDRSPKTRPAPQGHARLQSICEAAIGQSAAIATIQEVHSLLDRLEAWNARHASALTWPATVEGFVKAISRDIEAGHEDAVLMQILVPGLVNLALAPAASSPDTAATRQEDAAATPASNSQPSSSDLTEVVSPSSPVKTSKPVREAPETPRRPVASSALALKLLDIVNGNPGGIASEKIDATIKSLIASQTSSDPTRSASVRFKFFVQDLMPSIAVLDSPSIQKLMQCWPANAHVDIARPEALLSRTDFWVAMKAGGPESRISVMSEVLPKIFNGESWSPERSLEALQQMMARVRSPEEFSRRLDLWGAWGGNLDAPIIKPASDSDNDFSAPTQGPVTARSWLEENMPAHQDQLPSSRRSPRGP